jgi:CheY-like chemotaxis protein
MRGMRILCVEKRPEDMAVLAYRLEGIGCDVMQAINGNEAADLCSKKAIDGVLLEYNLPDATGTEIRDRLKSMQPIFLFSCLQAWAPKHPSCFASSMCICGSARNSRLS